MSDKVVRAKNSMHVSQFIMLHGGDESGLVDLWAADDPLVLAHPEWFTDDLESVARRTSPKVETASSKQSGGKIRTATAEPSIA